MIARDGNEPSSQRRHPAAVVALTSGRALVGPYDGRLAHGFQWVVFGVDALVLTGAVLYFTFVRFDRMF